MHFTDTFVQNYFSLVRTPVLTQCLYIFTQLFDVSIYSALVGVCIAYFIYLVRGLRYSILFVSTIGASGILVGLLKFVFNVARPTDAVMHAFGQSFPSYHATISAVFFIILMYIFDDYLSSFFRIVFNAFCVGAIFVVAFSRVYLGVHWISDVFAGVVIGSVISYGAILIFRKSTARL